jgi:hypothetical protein
MQAKSVFTEEWAQRTFPPERTDAFFEALFDGAEEGAYDIVLRFVGESNAGYEFAFDLKARAGRCLACSITYGLPHVFSRHPVIDIKGVVAAVAEALGKSPEQLHWELQPTREVNDSLFSVPLVIGVRQGD